MTTTPPPAPEQEAPTGPRVSHEEMRDLGQLRRSRTDRKLAGVAGGIGRHFDIDPTIVRVAFVVLAIFGGAGLLLYVVGWLLLPEEGSDRARVNLEASSRSIVLIVFAAIAGLMTIGDSWGLFGFPWPVLVLGIVVLAILLSRKDRTEQPDRVSLSKDPAPGYPAPGYPATGSSVGWVGAPADPSTASPSSGGSSYGGPTYGGPTYGGPTYADPAFAPAPGPAPKPYRGPALFWVTVALIALALGGLRLVELAGTDLPTGAYPALALGVCGVMLVVGAWFGRAGGVLFLAMLAGLGLGAANLAQHGIADGATHRPVAAADVKSYYSMGVGDLTIDLSDVSDVTALNDRTIRVHGNIGAIEVIVPEGMDVTATGDISAGGDVDIFGENRDGDSPRLTRSLDAGDAVPHLTVNADLDLGTITVRTP